MARKKIEKPIEEKTIIPRVEEGYINEYLDKLKKEGYEADVQEGIITVYVEEITEVILKEIQTVMYEYKKSYGILPKSRRIKKD